MFHGLLRDRRGAIAILSAFVLIAVIGVSALAVEFGRGLYRHVQNQQIADIAAYSGALVYDATGSIPSVDSAVANIVSLNGLAGSSASASVDTNHQTVIVTVTTSDPLLLARFLNANMANLPVSATATAQWAAGTAACIIALNPKGSGISLSGTGSIGASACAVASNSTVCADGGANPSDVITTKALGYDSVSSPSSSSCTLTLPSGTAPTKTSIADPICGNVQGQCSDSAVSTAINHLTTVVYNITSPSVTGGTDVDFGYNVSSTQSQVSADGCSATFASTNNTWTVTCPTGTPSFTFGNIVLEGGITVNFNMAGASSVTYNFGKGSQSCNGVQGYSLCNTGTALNMGPGTYILAGGIYNGGGATMTIGSGNSNNSFTIGAAGDGNSINVSTSQSTTLGDATGNGDVFQTAGNIVSGGGTCFTLSAAAEHDINGYISLSGGTTFGAGVWTVYDYVAFGAGGGGDVPCNGSSIGIVANGVTFVIGGNTTYSGQAFYDAAGFDNSTLAAPTSGATAGLLVIGPTSLSNSANPAAGVTFDQGASGNTLSGVFYFPNGPVDFGGAASAGGSCLELIGASITLANGTAAGTTCGSNVPQSYIGRGIILVN